MRRQTQSARQELERAERRAQSRESESTSRSAGPSSAEPAFPGTTDALRRSPLSFARFMGDKMHGATYTHTSRVVNTLRRELGGGMSRVFVAGETRYRRRVVLTVLAPELAEGLSGERFPC